MQLLSLAVDMVVHRCLTPVTTDVSGAEEVVSWPLDMLSLVHRMVFAPVLQLGTTGASGAT